MSCLEAPVRYYCTDKTSEGELYSLCVFISGLADENYILVLFYHIGSKDLIKKHLLDLLANKEEEREGKETTRLCKKLSNFSNIVFEK